MITAVILARNSARTIQHAIRSVSWCDSIFLCDDHSSDGTAESAMSACSIPIHIEMSPFRSAAFEAGELGVRNYTLARAEEVFPMNAMVLLDADETMDQALLPFVRKVEQNHYASISLSIFHLFDAGRYIRYRETFKYGLYQVDPHVRVVRRGMRYTNLRPGDEGHPLMPPVSPALHLHGPFHFHLKYLSGVGFRNASLEFLPAALTEDVLAEFLTRFQFCLPQSIATPLQVFALYPDQQGDQDELPVTSAGSASIMRATCLVVTAGAPSEASLIRRITELLGTCAWVERVQVLCSHQMLNMMPTSIAKWTKEDAVIAAKLRTHFDIIFQLSTEREIIKIGTRFSTAIRRGLTLSLDEQIRPANILAVGYFRAIREGGEEPQLIRLAMQACEME